MKKPAVAIPKGFLPFLALEWWFGTVVNALVSTYEVALRRPG